MERETSNFREVDLASSAERIIPAASDIMYGRLVFPTSNDGCEDEWLKGRIAGSSENESA